MTPLSCSLQIERYSACTHPKLHTFVVFVTETSAKAQPSMMLSRGPTALPNSVTRSQRSLQQHAAHLGHCKPRLQQTFAHIRLSRAAGIVVRYKGDGHASSTEAAAEAEMMTSAGVAAAGGVDLQSSGKGRSASMQKLKTQVDEMASK